MSWGGEVKDQSTGQLSIWWGGPISWFIDNFFYLCPLLVERWSKLSWDSFQNTSPIHENSTSWLSNPNYFAKTYFLRSSHLGVGISTYGFRGRAYKHDTITAGFDTWVGFVFGGSCRCRNIIGRRSSTEGSKS
jgi:hypothetical protein